MPERGWFLGGLVSPLTAWWQMVGDAKTLPGIWVEKLGEQWGDVLGLERNWRLSKLHGTVAGSFLVPGPIPCSA